MAQRVVTKMVSDLSGEELDESGQTIEFGWLGTVYEVDVSPAEAEEFARAVEPYVKAGRRIRGGRRPSPLTSPRTTGQLGAVRAWARENDYPISDRGPVPLRVLDAYEAAHS